MIFRQLPNTGLCHHQDGTITKAGDEGIESDKDLSRLFVNIFQRTDVAPKKKPKAPPPEEVEEETEEESGGEGDTEEVDETDKFPKAAKANVRVFRRGNVYGVFYAEDEKKESPLSNKPLTSKTQVNKVISAELKE